MVAKCQAEGPKQDLPDDGERKVRMRVKAENFQSVSDQIVDQAGFFW